MKYSLLALSILLLSSPLLLAETITEKVITPDNISKLGFTVSIEVTPEAVSIQMKGPKVINKQCFISRSGNALLDKNGNELAEYSTHLNGSQIAPSAYGYYTNRQSSMSVWMEYTCTVKNKRESHRYIVPSVSQYLLKSLGG